MTSTTPIIPSDRRPYGSAVAAVALAALLLALSLPRLAAALLALPPAEAVASLYGDARPGPAKLIEAAADFAQAGAVLAQPGYDLDRGLLLLQAARLAPADAEATRLLAEARQALVRGLAAAPLQPSAWLRLVALRQQAGDRPGAAEAMRLALLTGPAQPAVAVPRLKLALALWPVADEETRLLVRRQVRLAWILAPAALSGLAVDDETAGRLKAALAELSDEETQQFLHARKLVP